MSDKATVSTVACVYVDVFIAHGSEGFTEVFQQTEQKTASTDQHQGFFVEDIDFLGDQECSKTSAKGDITRLGDERVAGKGIDNAVGFLLGVYIEKSQGKLWSPA